MKKSLFLLLVATIAIFASCDRKKKEAPKKNEVNVETVISADKVYMSQTYGDFMWYETTIVLKDYIDEDSDGSVESVLNAFQTVVGEEGSFDTNVIHSTWDANGNERVVISGFYLEDMDMSEDTLVLTFKDAFDAALKANYVKPHSKQCVLRKEVGPKAANPQYIFGNNMGHLYVDAMTGIVSDKSPAFDE